MALGTSTKVSLYYPDKYLGVGSYSYSLTEEEALKCYEFDYNGEDYDGNNIGAVRIMSYYKKCGKEVLVPTTINGKTVTTIYEYAYQSKELTSVIIPDTIVSIQFRGFYNNNITNLILPNTKIKIGSQAFGKNLLDEIIVTSNMSLGGGAYSDNRVDENNAFIYQTLADGTKNTSKLLGYAGESKDIVIPEGVTEIAGSAFRSMKMNSIVLPSTLKVIGSRAFEGNNLTSINLPEGLTTIGEVAFGSNLLETTSNIPSSVTKLSARAFNHNNVSDGSEYVYARTKNGINYASIVSYAGAEKEISIPDVKENTPLTTIGNWAFYACGITKIKHIPTTVTAIGADSFTNNATTGDDDQFIYARTSTGGIDYSKIISYAGKSDNVVIPAKKGDTDLTTIGASSFTWCGLKSVVVPDGVTTIEANAFRYNQLTSITLPSSLTSIGDAAFCKSRSYNKMSKLVYKGTTEFNFGKILCGTSDTFASGVVTHTYGDITVTNA
jgi:hypothetical protein